MKPAHYLESIGKNKDYFHTLKSKKGTLYRFLMFIGQGDILKGHSLFNNKCEQMKIELRDLSYEDEVSFVDMLHKKGIISHKGNALRFITDTIYSNQTLNIKSYKLAKNILKGIR